MVTSEAGPVAHISKITFYLKKTVWIPTTKAYIFKVGMKSQVSWASPGVSLTPFILYYLKNRSDPHP